MPDSAHHIDLSRERRELLARLLHEEGLRASADSPREDEDVVPLSFAQERLWFLSQLEPDGASFNVADLLWMDGQVDSNVLQQSLNAVVARHDVLRTCFYGDSGYPRPIVLPEAQVAVSRVDLRGHAAAERADLVRAHVADVVRKPFDLTSGPPVHAALLLLDEGRQAFVIAMHHIVSDAWSKRILMRELAAFYTAFTTGEAPRLSPLRARYSDFARRQRAYLEGDRAAEDLAYWTRKLRSVPGRFTLDGTHARPKRRRTVGTVRPFRLDRGLSSRLVARSREAGCTLFMTLTAALHSLLFLYTGRGDVVTGTDFIQRNRTEYEDLIGCFLNQVVLPARLDGKLTLSEILSRTRRDVVEAFSHAELPFDHVVRTLRPPRDPGYAPLFQIKLFLQHDPIETFSLPGVEVRVEDVDTGAARLDMTFGLWTGAAGLAGWLNYRTDLFDAEAASAVSTSFERVLRHFALHPDHSLESLRTHVTDFSKTHHEMDRKSRRGRSLGRPQGAQRRAVTVNHDVLVRFQSMRQGMKLPLVAEPALEELDLPEWLRSNSHVVEEHLAHHGALLFRGFDVRSEDAFEEVARGVCSEMFTENSEHEPLSAAGIVQTPVFYAPHAKLLWHNENSFNFEWPVKIVFGCFKPARSGGETPLCDSRQVYRQLPTAVRDRFVEKGVMYVRRFGSGLGLDWQTVFRTEERSKVEEICRRMLVDFEWLADGGLETRTVRPAVVRHHVTGEPCWFNQAQHWHPACLDAETRTALRAATTDVSQWPRDCRYGDGSAIADETMHEILARYRGLEAAFPWEAGDVLLVDNVLTAHGRNPYEGDRTIVVAMGDLRRYDVSDHTPGGS